MTACQANVSSLPASRAWPNEVQPTRGVNGASERPNTPSAEFSAEFISKTLDAQPPPRTQVAQVQVGHGAASTSAIVSGWPSLSELPSRGDQAQAGPPGPPQPFGDPHTSRVRT